MANKSPPKMTPKMTPKITHKMTTKMFICFIIIYEMAWTFDETVRIDENESIVYDVKDNLFKTTARHNNINIIF